MTGSISAFKNGRV